MKTRHPMQPLRVDDQGTLRFKQNKIVRFLLDNGPTDMNSLARMPFDNEDFEQFAQLIGYSVAGFCDLSYASERVKDKAERKAKKIRKERDGR